MLADDDAPPDVKKATSVSLTIQRGERDDTFEGNPRVQKRTRKWVHCDERKPKPRKGDGNGGCCQTKREQRRQKEKKFTKITVYGEPCEIPKQDVVPRHCLTKTEHLDLLSKPKQRCPTECRNEQVLRRVRPISPRVRELAKPPRRRVLMTLREGATRLPASFLDNLVSALEEESCMTPEQATTITRSRKAEKKSKTKTKGKPEVRVGGSEWGYGESPPPKVKKANAQLSTPLDRESVICQYMMAERFVKSILKWKCPIPREEFRDIAQVLIKRLSSTLEYTPTDDEDRKSQQMRFLADILAAWISGVITEVAEDHAKELKERCKKKEERRKALEKEDQDDDKFDDDDDKYGGQRGLSDYDDDGSHSIFSSNKSKDKSSVSIKRDVSTKSGSSRVVDEEEEIAGLYAQGPMGAGQGAAASSGQLVAGGSDWKVGTGLEGAEMEQAMEAKVKSDRDLAAAASQAKVDAISRGRTEERLTDGEAGAGLSLAVSKTTSIAASELGGTAVAASATGTSLASGKPSAHTLQGVAVSSATIVPSQVTVIDGTTITEEVIIEGATIGTEMDLMAEAELEGAVGGQQSKRSLKAGSVGPGGEVVPPPFGDKEALETFLKTDLPFLTFDKIVDTIYKMVEDAPMNTGEDTSINNLHRAIYEKLKTIVAMDSPDLLTEEMKQKLHVTCGKIAAWLHTLLSESQIAFMEKYVPEVESKEIKDWIQWLCYVCSAANDWKGWLHTAMEDMDEMSDARITRGQWHEWTKRLDKGALLWRLFHLEAKHRARKNLTMMSGRQVVPTGTLQKGPFNTSEQVLRATDLHA